MNEIPKGGRGGEHSRRTDDRVPPSPTFGTKEQRYYRRNSADILAEKKRRYSADEAMRQRIAHHKKLSRLAERMLDWWRNECPKSR